MDNRFQTRFQGGFRYIAIKIFRSQQARIQCFVLGLNSTGHIHRIANHCKLLMARMTDISYKDPAEVQANANFKLGKKFQVAGNDYFPVAIKGIQKPGASVGEV